MPHTCGHEEHLAGGKWHGRAPLLRESDARAAFKQVVHGVRRVLLVRDALPRRKGQQHDLAYV